MSHILTIMQFKSSRICSELITVKLTAITTANTSFRSPCDWLFCPYTALFPPPQCFKCVLVSLEGISWGNKPENSQIRPNKSTKLTIGDTVKSAGSFVISEMRLITAVWMGKKIHPKLCNYGISWDTKDLVTFNMKFEECWWRFYALVQGFLFIQFHNTLQPIQAWLMAIFVKYPSIHQV